MKQVKISEAKTHLSKHIAYVRRGGRVRIFDRDVAVADLVPISVADEEDDDAELAAMERRGVVKRGANGPVPAEILSAGPSNTGVLTALLEERREGR